MTPSFEETVEQTFQNALALHRSGQTDAAAESYRRIIEQVPGHARALHSLGVLEKGRGNAAAAADLIGRAIAILPDAAEFHNNLGDALMTLCRYDEAVSAFGRSIRLSPTYVKALNNLGNVLTRVGRHAEAVASFTRAIELQPDYSRAHSNLAGTLTQMGRQEEAIAAYRRAIELDPGNLIAQSNLLMTMHYVEHAPREVFEAHRNWGRRFADPLTAAAAPHANDRNAERPLRIGYVSGDFNDHAVSSFFWPVLASHDRERFSVTCYSNVASPDATTARIRELAGAWRDIVGVGDERAAQLVRDDRIDILIDLAGHSARHRLLVLARRPAPVQVTWLGYPDTTGMAAIDYRITDAVADPPGEAEALHTERLVRLRSCWCYQPPGDMPIEPSSRQGVTFGSFNTLAKVSAATIRLWANVLDAIPGSRLIIKAAAAGDPDVQRRLSAALGDRLTFLPREPDSRKHLALYSQIDVILDTFPYNGTTMTCEALWMGVPVVTLAGRNHVSRVGASLLSSVGLMELIATTSADFVERAKSAPRLKDNVRQRMAASPLVDRLGFTRDLEAAYRRMWRDYCG